MYERSAIVLEKNFSKIFGLNKLKNLKTNYEEYAQMIEEIKEYQRVMQEEEKIMKKFEEAAAEIEEIQKKAGAEINKAKEETDKIRESYLNKEIELKSTDKWEN